MYTQFTGFVLAGFVFLAAMEPVKAVRFTTSTPTNLNLIFKASDPAPAEIGGTFFRLAGAAISDDGNVAFSSSLFDSTVSSALFLKSGNDLRVLLCSGEQAPEGGRYKSFLELDYSSLSVDGEQGAFLLFRAELEGGSASEGLFLWSADEVKVIALAGGRSPRGRTYQSFTQPTLVTVRPTSGIGYIVAFTAQMAEGRKSIVFHPSFLPVSEPLSTKDRLGQESVRNFEMSQIGGNALSCVVEVSNPAGKRFKRVVTVLDGVIIHGGPVKERGKIPGFGKIKSISSPPAITLQLGFVSVGLKNGMAGLMSRNILGDGFLFAKTGDPAPGLPGETIESFGPPISNPGFPLPALANLVSLVRLSDGRLALYFFGVSSAEPFQGDARLLLIQGDSIGSDSTLLAFAPLDISNNGALLLRGSIGDGANMFEGLFVMDGLSSSGAA